VTITFHPRGPFSLTAAATFVKGFPGTQAEQPPHALRYAWAVDGDWRTVQATVRQGNNAIHAELGDHGAFPPPARVAQLPAPQRGLTTRKVDQPKTLAAVARDGALTREQPGLAPSRRRSTRPLSRRAAS